MVFCGLRQLDAAKPGPNPHVSRGDGAGTYILRRRCTGVPGKGLTSMAFRIGEHVRVNTDPAWFGQVVEIPTPGMYRVRLGGTDTSHDVPESNLGPIIEGRVVVAPKRFASLESWAGYLNTNVGNGNWYIAGGCAAWLHIDAYADKDANDYAAFSAQIFPGDIEGGGLEDRVEALHALHGKMVVSVSGHSLNANLDPLTSEQLAIQKDLCEQFALPSTSILVYSKKNLIAAYGRAANTAKEEKRQLRVAIMRLMDGNQRITATSVKAKQQTARPNFAQQLLAGVKLKPPKQ